jgi:hypothetical protein
MTESGNSISQRKDCVSECSGVKREDARREHPINSQTQGEISRWLSTLERKTVWNKAQFKVTEHSKILFQEGIEIV